MEAILLGTSMLLSGAIISWCACRISMARKALRILRSGCAPNQTIICIAQELGLKHHQIEVR